MPFKYDKKVAYGSKLTVFFISGFALPFVAAYYQMYVSSHTYRACFLTKVIDHKGEESRRRLIILSKRVDGRGNLDFVIQ